MTEGKNEHIGDALNEAARLAAENDNLRQQLASLKAEAEAYSESAEAERDELLKNVKQKDYPCSPFCDGYLREREQKRRADALEQALRNCVEALNDGRIGTTQMDDPDLYRKFNKAVSIALAAFPPDHPVGVGDAVYIIRTDKGLWRPKAAGYTSNPNEAGRYTWGEAVSHTRGLGPEKQAEVIHERDVPDLDCCARARADERERCARVVEGHEALSSAYRQWPHIQFGTRATEDRVVFFADKAAAAIRSTDGGNDE